MIESVAERMSGDRNAATAATAMNVMTNEMRVSRGFRPVRRDPRASTPNSPRCDAAASPRGALWSTSDIALALPGVVDPTPRRREHEERDDERYREQDPRER